MVRKGYRELRKRGKKGERGRERKRSLNISQIVLGSLLYLYTVHLLNLTIGKLHGSMRDII